jgi:hypothetical protein
VHDGDCSLRRIERSRTVKVPTFRQSLGLSSGCHEQKVTTFVADQWFQVSNIRVILGILDDALNFEAHTGSLTKLPTPPRERRSPVTDPQPSLNRAPRARPVFVHCRHSGIGVGEAATGRVPDIRTSIAANVRFRYKRKGAFGLLDACRGRHECEHAAARAGRRRTSSHVFVYKVSRHQRTSSRLVSLFSVKFPFPNRNVCINCIHTRELHPIVG